MNKPDTTDKATARPWQLLPGQDLLEIVKRTNGSGHPLIADLSGSPLAEREANAALIMAAVNEREALLAALEAIHAALVQPVQFTKIRNGASCDVLRGDCALAANMAAAALALVRGEGSK